ncbi:ester cyclase [Curtobacterium sp. PhB136]|uniref:ester cyclase n=1 Tax=Curtobacterium sp. PhB136 TaxID=2485181 RepID=UPI001051321B|nr:ester cyclase [Curtobacterium sp. PhB136]TCK65818.1 SnoaL-like polyketide cyclase [Curtobacterium sp. PhB136]
MRSELQQALDIFHVLESGDVALARRTAAPNFRNREAAVAPRACSIPGAGGLLASSAWMRGAFDELTFPIVGSAFDGEHAWIRLRMQGIQRRPFVQFRNGQPDRVMPATGRRINFEQIHVLRVGPEGVTGHEAVRDDVTMLQQLGAFPPSPSVMLGMLNGKVTGAARRAARDVSKAADVAAAQVRTA